MNDHLVQHDGKALALPFVLRHALGDFGKKLFAFAIECEVNVPPAHIAYHHTGSADFVAGNFHFLANDDLIHDRLAFFLVVVFHHLVCGIEDGCLCLDLPQQHFAVGMHHAEFQLRDFLECVLPTLRVIRANSGQLDDDAIWLTRLYDRFTDTARINALAECFDRTIERIRTEGALLSVRPDFGLELQVKFEASAQVNTLPDLSTHSPFAIRVKLIERRHKRNDGKIGHHHREHRPADTLHSLRERREIPDEQNEQRKSDGEQRPRFERHKTDWE